VDPPAVREVPPTKVGRRLHDEPDRGAEPRDLGDPRASPSAAASAAWCLGSRAEESKHDDQRDAHDGQRRAGAYASCDRAGRVSGWRFARAAPGGRPRGRRLCVERGDDPEPVVRVAAMRNCRLKANPIPFN
jgi:hypothetical protein